VSKRGKFFKGALVRKASGRHGFEFPPRAPRGSKRTLAGGDGTPSDKPVKPKKAREKKPAPRAKKKVAASESAEAPAAAPKRKTVRRAGPRKVAAVEA
jgi:hypothetical protein